MNLTKEELNYLLVAIDTYIKEHGIRVAGQGVVLVQKLQEYASQFVETVKDGED